jgi:hypothetical protein
MDRSLKLPIHEPRLLAIISFEALLAMCLKPETTFHLCDPEFSRLDDALYNPDSTVTARP